MRLLFLLLQESILFSCSHKPRVKLLFVRNTRSGRWHLLSCMFTWITAVSFHQIVYYFLSEQKILLPMILCNYLSGLLNGIKIAVKNTKINFRSGCTLQIYQHTPCKTSMFFTLALKLQWTNFTYNWRRATVLGKQLEPMRNHVSRTRNVLLCNQLNVDTSWWLVELPMWSTDGFSVTFFGRWRGAVRIHVSHMQLTCVTCSSHVANYYMLEGSPHVWLTCVTCGN